jgi:isoquinoline 1-oxidoreductase beta subunit
MSMHKDDAAGVEMSRRTFLGTSAGLAFAFTIGLPALAVGGKARADNGKGVLNAYVSIAPDGTVTIQAPAPEMGQGILTGLPMIVAEELDADWAKVVVQQSPIDAAYNHPIFRAQYVVASISTLGYWTPLRIAGAQARRVLIDAAAARWGVPAGELTTEPGIVVHAASGRRMSYGEIASFATVPAELPKIDPAKDLKPADRYRLLGKGVPRVDVPSKTNGTARFGIDARTPGMLHATFVRAPVRGSGPQSSNAAEVKRLPGIVDVVTLDHGVAVVGRSFPEVLSARRRLQVAWRSGVPGDTVNPAKDFETYLAHVRDGSRPAVEWKSKGKAIPALQGATRVVAREYLNEFVYHAQMEPMNAMAYVRPDGVDVWVGTQAPTRTTIDVAKAVGTTPDKVRVHQHVMGGGFGRRATVEASVDAALISRAVNEPVKLLLSREDDLRAGTFRPMTAQRIEAGLDKDGRIVGWRHRVAGEPVGDFLYHPGYVKNAKDRDVIFMSGCELPYYDKVENWVGEHVFEPERSRVAAWRGIGSGYTKFAIESMLDEIAYELKVDPLAYRLSLTADPRARAVLEKVAEMSQWQRKRSGTALGLAFAEYGAFAPKVGSLSAAVAEVSVDRRTGRIRVHNYWVAADAGLPVNPVAFTGQVESGVIWGLSGALKEAVRITDGAVQQSNFADYPILRMSEAPNIQVELVRSGSSPTMVGELGVPGTAPAVANAVFALTGKRLRHLPMTPEKVLAALKA